MPKDFQFSTRPAIIIGGHFQGLGAIRALGEKNVPVVLMDSEPNIGRFSRYVSQYIKSPKITAHDTFLAFLIDVALKRNLKGAVIYPINDETVEFLSKNHETLSQYYTLWTPAWQNVEPLFHKGIGYKLAEHMGIPIPITAYPRGLEDVKNYNGPYPALIKPAVMRRFFTQTGKKVFSACNREELIDAYQRALEFIPADEILIQEKIPDVAENLYSFCPLFDGEKVLARIIAKRLRQHPMDFGQASTFAETVQMPELEVLGARYLHEVGYSGLGEVEFIRDPRDGTFKFLEVNPRIWGWHTLAVAAGVNLPYLTYLWSIGKTTAQEGYGQARWMRLLTDVAVGITETVKGRWTFRSYLNSIRGPKAYAVWSLNDPLPFFGELLLLPYLMIKRGF